MDAVAEGTAVHAGEPLLRVEGRRLVCQLVESTLLNLINFQTLIATKAARMVGAAAGRPVVDFGFRRAHGAEAGVLAARSRLHRRLRRPPPPWPPASRGGSPPPAPWPTAT